MQKKCINNTRQNMLNKELHKIDKDTRWKIRQYEYL